MLEINVHPEAKSPRTIKELANWLRDVAAKIDTIPNVPLHFSDSFYEIGLLRDEDDVLEGLYVRVSSLDGSTT